MNIGGKVKELRKALGGISQAELAKRLGLTANAVAAWEQGVREPDEINCLRLSRLAEGPLSDYFAGRMGSGQLLGDAVEPSLRQLRATVTEGFERIEKTLTLILEEIRSHQTASPPGRRPPSSKSK